MQTAFAYRQCKEANYGNALENIRQEFLPDLNSMDPQDPQLLSKQGKEAQELFIEFVNTGKVVNKGSDERINVTVNSEIREYHKLNLKDRRFLQNQMLLSSEQVYHYYLLNLLLLLEFRQLAEQDKKSDHQKFINNKVLSQLKLNSQLSDDLARNNLSWKADDSEVRQWFRDFVKTDEEYLNYNKQENVNFESDQEIILHLIKKVLFDKDIIDSYWQDKDLQWAEDRPVILSMLKKTIK